MNFGSRSASNSKMFSSCSFSNLGLHPILCDQLKERLGFEAPTLVQAEAIPVVLSGRHVLVNAPTGTGKTVAYLAPIIHLLQGYDQRIQRSDALVLVPTRELCMQVYEILQKLLHRFHWIVPGYIMGGENRGKEKSRLRKGISILIATPGRLLDHLKNTSSFLHSKLRWVIFDEADSILELGYGKDIEEILNFLHTRHQQGSPGNLSVSEVQRQNLLLSATLNDRVNHLAKISLENPVMIGLEVKKNLSSHECDTLDVVEDHEKMSRSSLEKYKIPSQLVQRFIKVPCSARLVMLLSILKHLYEREATQKVVVFFSTCGSVDFHYSLFNGFHWASASSSEAEKETFLRCKALRLHGKMNQEDRKTTFLTFKTEKSALLLSTDVCARGLDFPKVRCIVQYDPPGEASEYVHRVGRTARLGEKGDSLLFLQPVEMDYLKELEKHGVMLTEYPILKLLNSFSFHSQKDQSDMFISHPWLLALQRALESFISAVPSVNKLARATFCSWVRAYTAHRGELKRIFMVKKLHLGHVARSFVLKEQPSLVNKSLQKEIKKRKRKDTVRRAKSKRASISI